jgi:hypothetical protein
MPAIVSLKFSSWAWTSDGRLVVLAESEGATLVGIWKPGDERIGVTRVRLPERNSGSDSFVVLTRPPLGAPMGAESAVNKVDEDGWEALACLRNRGRS